MVKKILVMGMKNKKELPEHSIIYHAIYILSIIHIDINLTQNMHRKTDNHASSKIS